MNNVAAVKDREARRGIGLVLLQAEHLERARLSADAVYRLPRRSTIPLEIEGVSLPRHLRRLRVERDTLLILHTNAYVNTGLNNALDREFGLGGVAVADIGFDCDTSAVTAATTFLHGSATAANNTNTIGSGATAGGNTVTLAAGAVPAINAGFWFAAGGATAEALVVTGVAGQVITFDGNLQFTHTNGSAVAWTGQIIKTISPSATRTNQTTTGGATFANSDFLTDSMIQTTTGAHNGSAGVFKINKLGFLNTATDAGTGLIDVIGGVGSGIYSRTFSMDITNVGAFTVTPQLAVTAIAI